MKAQREFEVIKRNLLHFDGATLIGTALSVGGYRFTPVGLESPEGGMVLKWADVSSIDGPPTKSSGLLQVKLTDGSVVSVEIPVGAAFLLKTAFLKIFRLRIKASKEGSRA